jgi:hypothetical protein
VPDGGVVRGDITLALEERVVRGIDGSPQITAVA